MPFNDKVVIITGASSGIGWSLAKLLGQQGAKLGLLARRKEKLEELAREITQLGGTAEIAPADVGEKAQTDQSIHSLRERLGPVDLLVAGAGVASPTPVDHRNVEETQRMFEINLHGVVYAIGAVLPEMLQRRQGHIAAISSLAAYRSFPGKAGYCASKAAVNSYLDGLRIQLRNYGITVTTICPGFVATPMTDDADYRMPWLISADDAAKRIARGLERKVKVLNFPWQTTLLVKFSRWLPDWFMARQRISYSGEMPDPTPPSPVKSSG